MLVEGEDDDGVNSLAIFLVQAGEVEEDALGEVCFGGGLGFDVDEDGGGLAELLDFDEKVNDFVFPGGEVGEIFLGQEADGIGVDRAMEFWQE